MKRIDLIYLIKNFLQENQSHSCPILILFAILLTACGQPPTATPLPEAIWLRVEISPALNLPADLLAACTPEGAGLAIQGHAGAAFPDELVDLRLRLGQDDSWQGYIARIGQDELVLAVHPGNPATLLELSALQTTYQGQLPAMDWDYLGQAPLPLTAYAYSSGSGLEDTLTELLLPEGQALSPEVVVAPGPAEVRTSIAADPGALGILPRDWVDESVKVIPLNGADGLPLPILSLSDHEPQGLAREWLVCVQGGMP